MAVIHNNLGSYLLEMQARAGFEAALDCAKRHGATDPTSLGWHQQPEQLREDWRGIVLAIRQVAVDHVNQMVRGTLQ